MNLNTKQILAICVAILSALAASTAQLTDLFGTKMAHTIISAAGLINMTLSSIVAAVSSQGSLVREVAAMPGVEKIRVNAQANQTLASVATDPAQPKVGPTPEDSVAVKAIATGATS